MLTARVVVKLIAKDAVTIRREQVEKQTQRNDQSHKRKAGSVPAGEILGLGGINCFDRGDSHESLLTLNEPGPEMKRKPRTASPLIGYVIASASQTVRKCC
jgi:hypothetical protein